METALEFERLREFGDSELTIFRSSMIVRFRLGLGRGFTVFFNVEGSRWGFRIGVRVGAAGVGSFLRFFICRLYFFLGGDDVVFFRGFEEGRESFVGKLVFVGERFYVILGVLFVFGVFFCTDFEGVFELGL